MLNLCRFFASLLILLFVTGVATPVLAVESVLASPVLAESTVVTSELQPVISARASVAVEKNLILSAARSYNPNPELPVFYSWNFGDGSSASGEEVVHVFRQAGVHEVTLTMRSGAAVVNQTASVFAYEQVNLLVSDNLGKEASVAALEAAAREEGNLLAVVRGFGITAGFFTDEGAIAAALAEKSQTLADSNLIILWTTGSNGLNGLTRFVQDQKEDYDFQDKRIVVITAGDLDALARIARGAFGALQPVEIIITREDALRSFAVSGFTETTLTELDQQAIPYRVVDSGVPGFSLFAPLSFFVSYLLSAGIPASVLLLVLMLPVIATIVAFLKQVVGVTTFGVYTPSVVTLSLLVIGLKLGLLILLIVVAASVIMRRLLKSYRLSYTPRMAIVLTGVALTIFAAIVLLTWLAPINDYAKMTDLITAAIFPMLIMGTLAEKFVSIQTEKGTYSAVRLTTEVTGVAVLCYFIVGEWEYFRTLMLATPDFVFLFLLADILLGRFTGLRITEYIRFKDVLKKAEEEE
jgi:hypothetical protein